MRAVSFEKAGRDPDLQFACKLLHRANAGMVRGWTGGDELLLVLYSAEIGAFKQLGRKDDLCALARSLADEVGDGSDVGVDIAPEFELERGDGDPGHSGDLYRRTPNRARMAVIAK